MIRLEKFTSKDFDKFKTWADSEEELAQFAGTKFTYPIPEYQLNLYISDPNISPYKVVDSDASVVIGHGEIYMREDRIPKLCRIIIGKEYRGKGIGGQVITELLKICFYQLKALRAELNVYDFNEHAIACYEKSGFVKNTINRKDIVVNGKTWTSINMYITRKAFEEVQRNKNVIDSIK